MYLHSLIQISTNITEIEKSYTSHHHLLNLYTHFFIHILENQFLFCTILTYFLYNCFVKGLIIPNPLPYCNKDISLIFSKSFYTENEYLFLYTSPLLCVDCEFFLFFITIVECLFFLTNALFSFLIFESLII